VKKKHEAINIFLTSLSSVLPTRPETSGECSWEIWWKEIHNVHLHFCRRKRGLWSFLYLGVLA